MLHIAKAHLQIATFAAMQAQPERLGLMIAVQQALPGIPQSW